MPRHSETRTLPYRPEQMFDLVADIARYPEFLPWVSAARVRPDGSGDVLADLVIGFGGLKEKFTSRVVRQRPGRLSVDYVSGPLRFLRNDWTFEPDGAGGCALGFRVDFAFKSRVLEALAGRVFDRALRHMIAAFEARAAHLYADTLYGVGAGASGISRSSAHSAA